MLILSNRFRFVSLVILLLLALAACSKNSTGDVDEDEEVDDSPPSPITSLVVVSFTDTSVTLSWTAPGDDFMSGTASRYDLRCSDSMITVDNFVDCQQVHTVPAPMISGTLQTIEVCGLTPNTRYYFAIIAFDEVDNYSSPSNVVNATPFVDMTVTFPDAALDAIIRDIINKPTGALTRVDVFDIHEINVDNAGVADLSGLEYCEGLGNIRLMNSAIVDLTPISGLVELWGLDLYGNEITNLTPLSGLFNLTGINLGGNNITNLTPLTGLSKLMNLRVHENPIADHSPLTSITSLTDLDVHSNNIADISFLAGLTNLQYVQLQVNTISDISPLAGLTELRSVALGINQVSDLTPLSNLLKIESLSLMMNQITDIAPLAANAGIGAGDVIWLSQNPLSQVSIDTHIPALQARGVTVNY